MAGTAIGVNAQSQDRENPTPLAANTVKGNGIGKKVEYYYSFTAGPGEVLVTVDLKAKAGSTNADVEIFDQDSKIFYVYPNATTTAEHTVKHFTLSSKQPLILRLSFDSSAGEYSIKLSGAVEFAAPAVEPAASEPAATAETSTVARRFGLHRSRQVVVRISALFALDSFAGGFVLQTLIAYWFHVRFGANEASIAEGPP